MPRNKIEGFSEDTFAFSVLFELKSHYFSGYNILPVIPTRRKEKDLGYDAKLDIGGFLMFIQFKTSKYRYGSNAKAMGFFGAPYYMFELRAKDGFAQNRALCKMQREGLSVFYMAPLFETKADLMKYASTTKVVEQTRCFEPSQVLGLPGSSRTGSTAHQVAFDCRGKACRCSRPAEIESLHFEQLIETRWRHLIEHPQIVGRDSYVNTALSLYSVARSLSTDRTHQLSGLSRKSVVATWSENEFGMIGSIAFIARERLGLDTILVTRQSTG